MFFFFVDLSYYCSSWWLYCHSFIKCPSRDLPWTSCCHLKWSTVGRCDFLLSTLVTRNLRFPASACRDLSTQTGRDSQSLFIDKSANQYCDFGSGGVEEPWFAMTRFLLGSVDLPAHARTRTWPLTPPPRVDSGWSSTLSSIRSPVTGALNPWPWYSSLFSLSSYHSCK